MTNDTSKDSPDGITPANATAQESSNQISNKLSKFGELERTPRRFDQPVAPPSSADPRVQTIQDAVKDQVRAMQNSGARFEVDSRTDVQRHLRVAVHKDEELLLINTDVYIPGQRLKKWRR